MMINDPVPTTHSARKAASRHARPVRLRRKVFRLSWLGAGQVGARIVHRGHGGGAAGAGAGAGAASGAGGTPGYDGVPSGPYLGAPYGGAPGYGIGPGAGGPGWRMLGGSGTAR